MLLAQPLSGIPPITGGDDLAAILAPVLYELTWPEEPAGLAEGDIVVVASKVVAKAERRLVAARDQTELAQAVADQTVRLVAQRRRPDGGLLQIVETPQGLVMAAAGVDVSDVPPGTALLLPADPDDSARRLRRGLHARLGVRPGVVIADTVGRPWRRGVVDIAIGAAGIQVLQDLRGQLDAYGRALESTVVAAADEAASVAELASGKASARPATAIRGLDHLMSHDDGPGASSIQRPPSEDMFRYGTIDSP